MKRIGLIGGTGLFGLNSKNSELMSSWNLKNNSDLIVETPYGEVPITVFNFEKE